MGFQHKEWILDRDEGHTSDLSSYIAIIIAAVDIRYNQKWCYCYLLFDIHLILDYGKESFTCSAIVKLIDISVVD